VTVAAWTLAACAGKRGGPCEAVPAAVSLAAGTEVFAECAVEKKAFARTSIKLDYRPAPGSPAGTYSATLEFVVDSTGSVLSATVREVQSTDRGFAESFTVSLLKQRFRPASIAGRPVAQLMRMTESIQLATFTVRRSP
jgi:hypothetical protein